MSKIFKIAITQREVSEPNYPEVRDALARDWWTFFQKISLPILPVLIPSNMYWAQKYWETQNFDGLILSGGNDINSAPQRDLVENFLLKRATFENIPILGICRGAQLIGCSLGLKLSNVNRDQHVASEHTITWTSDSHFLHNQTKPNSVNSYHSQALTGTLPQDWSTLAYSSDQVLEAFGHQTQKMLGIMWHPERETLKPLLSYHKSLFQYLFCET